jgi:HJR/Mrr/RecB family endonuclease
VRRIGHLARVRRVRDAARRSLPRLVDDQRHARLKIRSHAADARDVTAIARLSRAKRAAFGALFDAILQRLCNLTAGQSLLRAAVVYMGWGLAVPTVLGVGTIGFVTFATEGALFAGVILFARAIPFVEARLRRQQLQLTTSLRRLSGREFETLVQELFEREDWEVAHTGGHGQADGNIDLILTRATETRLVQCKQWTARDLGVDEVRKLGGTLLRHGLTGADGILVTSAGFYPTATTEAQQIGIELIDGDALVDRLHNVGASALLHRPTRSDSWLCPDCETPMSLSHSSYGWWLRCPNYGNGCNGKHDLGKDNRGVVERLVAGP